MWIAILITTFSFFSGAAGAFLLCKFGREFGLVDIPKKRSSHTIPTPRSGGIGIWLAFMLVGFFTEYQIFTIFAGIIGLIGFWEDRFSISQQTRLILQLIISALVIILFLGVPASITTVLLFIFWLVFITGTSNFYNFMDGIDGIAGLTGFVGFGFIALFSFYITEKYDVAMISTALSIGCLGFLPFNFPKARVFMGDVGSVFLGFIFASFTVKLSTSINIFLCVIMFMCVFYADSLITIYCRWKRGENLIVAHRSHLYQYLCNELKMPHWKVSIAYALTQVVFALLSLLVYKHGIIWQFALVVSFVVVSSVAYTFIKKLPTHQNLWVT